MSAVLKVSRSACSDRRGPCVIAEPPEYAPRTQCWPFLTRRSTLLARLRSRSSPLSDITVKFTASWLINANVRPASAPPHSTRHSTTPSLRKKAGEPGGVSGWLAAARTVLKPSVLRIGAVAEVGRAAARVPVRRRWMRVGNDSALQKGDDPRPRAPQRAVDDPTRERSMLLTGEIDWRRVGESAAGVDECRGSIRRGQEKQGPEKNET